MPQAGTAEHQQRILKPLPTPRFLSLFLGLRLLRTRRRHRFLSLVAVLSFGALALSVAVLIVVLSVMNGFDSELRRRILFALPHAELSVREGAVIRDWRALARRLEQSPEVLGAAPLSSGDVLLFGAGGSFQGVELRGVLPAHQARVSPFAAPEHGELLQKLRPGRWGLVLGAELARRLQVLPGDRVQVLLPEFLSTPFGALPRTRELEIVGTIYTGSQTEAGLALAHLEDANRLFRLQGETGGLQLRLRSQQRAPEVLAALAPEFARCCTAHSWQERHASLFYALRMEKIAVSCLLSFVILVSLFSLAVTLRVLVSEQRVNIAMLSILGARPGTLVSLFAVQGFVIVCAGILVGAGLGVLLAEYFGTLLAWWEQWFGVHLFDPRIYYISLLPSRLLWSDVLAVTGIALVLSLPAVLWPAARATRVRPAELLHHG